MAADVATGSSAGQEMVEEKLAELLEWVMEILKAGQDFVLDQAPMVAQEIVWRGRFMTTFWLLGAVLGVVWIFLVPKLVKTAAKMDSEGSYESEVVSYVITRIVVPGLFSVVMLITFFVNGVSAFMTAWAAPRLYVLDYIRSMM